MTPITGCSKKRHCSGHKDGGLILRPVALWVLRAPSHQLVQHVFLVIRWSSTSDGDLLPSWLSDGDLLPSWLSDGDLLPSWLSDGDLLPQMEIFYLRWRSSTFLVIRWRSSTSDGDLLPSWLSDGDLLPLSYLSLHPGNLEEPFYDPDLYPEQKILEKQLLALGHPHLDILK